GPVLFPGSKFNRHRDKLFFFSAFEYYYQTLDTGFLTATVPTAGMRQGNFSPSELAKLGTITASGGSPQQPSTDLFPTGIIPRNQIDKSGQGLMNLYPLPNANRMLRADTTMYSRRSSIRTAGSWPTAWITTSATIPSCSSDTTCRRNGSFSRW